MELSHFNSDYPNIVLPRFSTMYHYLAHIDPAVEERLIVESQIARQNQVAKLELLEKNQTPVKDEPDGYRLDDWDSTDESDQHSQYSSDLDEDVFTLEEDSL